MAGYACANLRAHGHRVRILDARQESFGRTIPRVLADSPELLAVHAVYFWERTPELFDFLKQLRRQGLSCPIALFGFFPSLCWRDLLAQYPEVDFVVVGEPEATLAELADAGGRPAGAMAGLAQRLGGRPGLERPRPPLEDLDSLPVPVRPGLGQMETVSVLASRGCFNGCSFCLIPALDQGRTLWRGRSAEAVIREISDLIARGKSDFYFVDPNFVGPGARGRRRALEMARALAPLPLTFGLETRAAGLDPELIQALAGAGLVSLLLGLESASPAALARMGKNAAPADNLAAVRAVRDAGLEPEIGFLMFDADAGLDDAAANLAFLQEADLLGRLGRTANLLCHRQIALKGSRLYARALAQGRLRPRGALGFEGVIAHRDSLLDWLAGAVQTLCLHVLRCMGEPGSPIHWSLEGRRIEPFNAVNRFLIESFVRLLGVCRSRDRPPDGQWTDSLLNEHIFQIQALLAGAEFEKEAS
jgi:radical SAM superfamily enzyme YgiQ (UPF0313 family)